jgi:hypothetical protein
MLRTILIAGALTIPFALHAQEKKEPAKKPTAQQERMTECNKKATGMKGDERKAFMSSCLSDTPQDRMTKCNKDASAKGMKGDERKKFMSECLKA